MADLAGTSIDLGHFDSEERHHLGLNCGDCTLGP